ncbi:MAG: hypothetical protein JWN99_3080 [Ilumatobacteraceae bacterium]|nr:hypothetical protein [Ilumatobacteraceae bacterium]
MGTHGRRSMAVSIVCAFATIAMLAGCSGDGATDSTTVATFAPLECAAATPVLRVDLIDAAVAAVEAQLGGPQRYFEINATDLLVNLFVAVDGGAQAQPFVFLQGELNSQDPKAAQGETFSADALDFDPQKVTSCVADQLPKSQATAFEVIGGPEGAVAFSVIVDSPEGGQLVVAVNGQGQILSVDPV